MSMAKKTKKYKAAEDCPCCSTDVRKVKTVNITFDSDAVEKRKEILGDLLDSTDSQTFCVNTECEKNQKYQEVIKIMNKR